MPKPVVDTKVSLNAIRRANQKRRMRGNDTPYLTHTGSNGEIYIKFFTGVAFKEVTLTRDQINSAYHRAVQKSAKKL